MTRTSLRMTSFWRHNDIIRDETRVIAPLQFWCYAALVFSVVNTFIVFAFKTPEFWPYMVMWREIWISLITLNSTPFYPIKMGFSPEIIGFYAENYYEFFTISFLNFLSDAKFGHLIWRHNKSHMGWNKNQEIGNLLTYLSAKFRYIRCILLLSMA